MRTSTHLARRLLITLLLGLALANPPSRGDVVTFEDLTVPQDGYYNGNPGNLSPGDEVSQPWSSGGASFDNTFGIDASFGFSYWSGFAYSDVVDSTTAGFGNQYAAYPGSGYLSPTYAVALPTAPPSVFHQRQPSVGSALPTRRMPISPCKTVTRLQAR